MRRFLRVPPPAAAALAKIACLLSPVSLTILEPNFIRADILPALGGHQLNSSSFAGGLQLSTSVAPAGSFPDEMGFPFTLTGSPFAPT